MCQVPGYCRLMSDESKERRVYGPSLLPDDVIPSGGIGPSIPEHIFKKKLAEDYESQPQTSRDFESLDTIGPLVPGQELREEWRHFKAEMDHESGVSSSTRTEQVRDAWMTELLPISNDVNNLKARKFRQSVGPNTDRCDSSWFKTPGASDDVNQKLELDDLKNQQKQMLDSDASSEYNKKMADIVAKCSKSSSKESLLEMHEKKLKHKLKKEKKKDKHKEKKHKKKHKRSPSPKEPQRRPFDRDKDLKISRIDFAARRAIIEHSKHLTSRFGHGKQQFL